MLKGWDSGGKDGALRRQIKSFQDLHFGIDTPPQLIDRIIQKITWKWPSCLLHNGQNIQWERSHMTSDSEGGRGFGVNWRQIFFTNLNKNWINFSLNLLN